MNAPDKIYLHGYSFSEEPVKSWEREPKVKRGVTGFKPQYAEYIRKDALLDWLEYTKKLWSQTGSSLAAMQTVQMVIDKINSL